MPRVNVLDDLDNISRTIDKSNMLSFITQAPTHYQNALEVAKPLEISYSKPKTIIVAGMGGSAIGGELLKDWSRDVIKIPVEVCREYSLPAYTNRDTLAFIVSYSGETEETLSTFLEALKKKCMIICISSGGTLHEIAEKLHLPRVLVPSGMAPRATIPYLFMPMLIALEKLELVSSVNPHISDAITTLKQISAENAPERTTSSNFAKTLATNIAGTVPVIYGFGLYRAVAQRLKTQFNENSKNPAKWETFPELNHNEIVGWEDSKRFAKLFSVTFLRGADESDEIRRRIEFTKDLICGENIRLFEIWSKGQSTLAKILSTVCIGDFVSVYLAILRGIDPTPVRTIALLKKRLGQSGFKEKIVRELAMLASK